MIIHTALSRIDLEHYLVLRDEVLPLSIGEIRVGHKPLKVVIEAHQAIRNDVGVWCLCEGLVELAWQSVRPELIQHLLVSLKSKRSFGC